MTSLRARLGWLAMAGMGVCQLGCQPPQTQDIPNRVLDRPTDLALTCSRIHCVDDDDDGLVEDDECRPQAVDLELCQQESSGDCSSRPSSYSNGIATGDYHLFGFIANSERNEVAMFAQCADRLIDMTIETPGYNFVPAGVLPTHLDATNNGCRVVSSNVGSCDLSVLDSEGLTSFGLGLELAIDEPSSLVTTLVPQRYDVAAAGWVPLGARPSELIAVPDEFSSAPANEGESSGDQCDPAERGSLYVTFPTCNTIAEIDVQTGHVLQSRQFISDGEGGVDVVDTGVSPACPVECPGQFDGVVPAGLPDIDVDGPFPQAIELLRPLPTSKQLDDADASLTSRSLFIGGLGSDTVFELRLSEIGEWGEHQSLELQGASGVSRIRVSPPVDFADANFGQLAFPDVADRQFLYVIVGDGSTRVISRELNVPDGGPLGSECDTQRDPVAGEGGADWACFPVSDADNVERRALVEGPGIRGGGGEITDWTFVKIYDYPSSIGGDPPLHSLFAQPGTFAVGTTTTGRVVYVMIDQSRVNGETTVSELTEGDVGDPLGLMRVDLAPHSLWTDGNFDPLELLPAVQDENAPRAFPIDAGPSRFLSPALRLIDNAYTREDRKVELLGGMVNRDLFGSDEEGVDALYEEDVPRIAVHDYRSWGNIDWSLNWEGIVFAGSSTGRFSCAQPGWEGGTCLVDQAGDSRLLDSAAKFCDSGVLPGDKLVIFGCSDDDECGTGRRCLRETSGGGESTGICVSGQAYEESAGDLRTVCRDFIFDPCGEAQREFTITDVYQDELWIQAMDIPMTSALTSPTPCPEGSNNQLEGDECVCRTGFEPDPEDQAPASLDCILIDDSLIPPDAPVVEFEGRFLCAEDQPDGGCVEDADCGEVEQDGSWQCIEERCRRPCEDASECMLRPLPGPTCFGEFVRYRIDLRNAFMLEGFPILDRVEPDPVTGQCVRSTSVENSALLTSRLPLPPSADPDDPDWNAIPLCPTDQVLPTDPNPCRIQSTSTDTRYHRLEYRGQPVDALRFSNPFFSIVVDLTSLEALTDDVPTYEDSTWPAEFAEFHRSRIPRGYFQEFDLGPGYQPFADLPVLENRPVTLPMRIVPGPRGVDDDVVVYIVDGAGPGTSSGIRGQVIRATLSDLDALVDSSFNGVR